MKFFAKLAITVVVVAVLIATAMAYFYYEKYYPNTSDAYLAANVAHIAAQVTGPVAAVYIANNATVKQGQLLVQIDPRPYQYKLTEAEAELKLSQEKEKSLAAQEKAVEASVAAAKAQLEVNQQNVPRTLSLVKQGRASAAAGVEAAGKLKTAMAAYQKALSEYIVAKQALVQQREATKASVSGVETAKLDLTHTKILAPAAGHIAEFSLRPGTTVSVGQALFAVVEDNQWWVNANFKETALGRIKINQPVTVSIDMYPGVTFSGYVQSISPGSGSAFSLFPAENATGNWVKVTQRFPVKIILQQQAGYPLRIGASCSVRIDTTRLVNQPTLPHE